MARVPGAGVGLEKAGWDMVESDGGALVPNKFCACGRLRSGVNGVAFVVVIIATPQEGASSTRGAAKKDKDGWLDDGSSQEVVGRACRAGPRSVWR